MHLPETSDRYGSFVEVVVDPGQEPREPAVRLLAYLADGSGAILRFDALEATGLATLLLSAAGRVAELRGEVIR